MAPHLAQVCLFRRDGSALKHFLEIVSGKIEIDNGSLLSFHVGSSTIAHHPPSGELEENDVLVTVEVDSPEEVNRLHRDLRNAKLDIDDAPEDTEWGWRIFYFRASPNLIFEVGAPLPS